MDDEKTIKLPSGTEAVIRTRVTMKDKLRATRTAARMMDMTLGEDNKPVVKILMSERVALDEMLLHRFVKRLGTADASEGAIDDLSVDDGEELLSAVWTANGDRLGIDRDSGIKTSGGKALPKASAES